MINGSNKHYVAYIKEEIHPHTEKMFTLRGNFTHTYSMNMQQNYLHQKHKKETIFFVYCF